MANLVKVGLIAAVLVGAGLGAAIWLGVLPMRSRADLDGAMARYAEAEALLRNGQDQAALGPLDESIRLYPTAGALRARANLHVRMSAFDEALRDISGAIRADGRNANDFSLRCWLRVRLDASLNSARSDCNRALDLEPTHPSAFGNRGLVGLKQRRFTEAWEDFNSALRFGGNDEWQAWRAFGRGVAAWERGDTAQGRQDIELALRLNPAVVADFTQFGIGGEIVRNFDDQAYSMASRNGTMYPLYQYLSAFPNGAHAPEARAAMAAIQMELATEAEAARRAVPGLSLAQVRGDGPSSDSYGAIAVSPSTWSISFATDYATGGEAERAAANACARAIGSPRDCDAAAFRNVCAALAVSPRERIWVRAWSHTQDAAVGVARSECARRGGRACEAMHSQCTPTPAPAGP